MPLLVSLPENLAGLGTSFGLSLTQVLGTLGGTLLAAAESLSTPLTTDLVAAPDGCKALLVAPLQGPLVTVPLNAPLEVLLRSATAESAALDTLAALLAPSFLL